MDEKQLKERLAKARALVYHVATHERLPFDLWATLDAAMQHLDACRRLLGVQPARCTLEEWPDAWDTR
jgi:hypothetical protein